MYINLLVNEFEIQMHVNEKCYMNYKLNKLMHIKCNLQVRYIKPLMTLICPLNRQEKLHAAQHITDDI